MTIKELRKASGMTQAQFAEFFNVPKRSVENWDSGTNKCPQYLVELMEYKLLNEKKIQKHLKEG